jgi:ornithine cyclodeaminase/alanine dehydrogenase-like protein (mu-crystallin family)
MGGHMLGESSVVCASGKEAITDADLIMSSVTYSATLEPFLDAYWLKPGALAAVTDLGVPWNKASLSAFNRIVIDDLQQEAALPNKLASPELVTGVLAGLVLRKFKGREQSGDRSAFIFRGHALGDLALAAVAYRKAGLKS